MGRGCPAAMPPELDIGVGEAVGSMGQRGDWKGQHCFGGHQSWLPVSGVEASTLPWWGVAKGAPTTGAELPVGRGDRSNSCRCGWCCTICPAALEHHSGCSFQWRAVLEPSQTSHPWGQIFFPEGFPSCFPPPVPYGTEPHEGWHGLL